MYEYLTDVEDANNQIDDFLGLVQCQTWEMTLMSIPKKKIAFSAIREFYHTLVNMNEGYHKGKVDR